MTSRKLLPIAVVALVLGGSAGALMVPTLLGLNDRAVVAASKQSGWTETPWPFPLDQFGRGKAFQCSASDCGTPLTVYVRAKIGFCNCTTGVADDPELERIGDLDLLGGRLTALGDGHPIAVAWMKGRSRVYVLAEESQPRKSALSIGYNDRCDAIVATAVVPHDRPADVEPVVLQFLNGPIIMRWAEVALGL